MKSENDDNIKPKKLKIEYYNENLDYLNEIILDLNNAIVITNNNFVDYLLYELNNNIYSKKISLYDFYSKYIIKKFK